MHNIKVTYLNKVFYHYDLYSNDNSIARNYSVKNINSLVYFISYFEKHLDGNKYSDEFHRMKEIAKDIAFTCAEYKYEEYDILFPEINSQYIKLCNPFSSRFYASISILSRNKTVPYLIFCKLKKCKTLIKKSLNIAHK